MYSPMGGTYISGMTNRSFSAQGWLVSGPQVSREAGVPITSLTLGLLGGLSVSPGLLVRWGSLGKPRK